MLGAPSGVFIVQSGITQLTGWHLESCCTSASATVQGYWQEQTLFVLMGRFLIIWIGYRDRRVLSTT